MNTSLWFGIEWELALSGIGRNGERVPIPRVLDHFDATLVKNVKHVDSEQTGWWLESGGKFYRDAGQGGSAHDEYASPECSHPDELLRQDMAAERLMLGVADLMVEAGDYETVRVSKANVSFVSQKSWGSHENYEARKPVPETPMTNWLASRILLTGAGGLDVLYPGIRFSISPRSHFIETRVNIQTEHDRGLHNVGKATPLGTKHRVHVVAGDGNRSHLSTWLRFASTALVVRMLDCGQGPDLDLPNIVRSLHEFALDPDPTREPLSDKSTSILGIQRAFLEAVKKCTCSLPDWAPRALEEWQRVLDALESKEGWRALVGQLDWATKRALFDKVLDRRGWTWERVNEVNQMIEGSMPVSQIDPSESRDPTRDFYFREEGALQYWPEESDRELIRDFEKLKGELATVEARYMELGKDSLYESVAKPVAVLKDSPLKLPRKPLSLPKPKSGRAKVRADLISRQGWKGGFKNHRKKNTHASWTHFTMGKKYLQMPEVSGVKDQTWRDVTFRPSRRSLSRMVNSPEQELLRIATQAGHSACDSGHYYRAAAALAQARPAALAGNPQMSNCESYWQQSVRNLGRLQNETDLPGDLEALEAAGLDRLECLWESCNSRALLGLAGHAMVPDLVALVQEELSTRSHPRVSGMACWKSHFALWLNHHCRPKEALELLESTLRSDEYQQTSSSVQSRIMGQLGEAHRMLGNDAEAEKHFEKAQLICTRRDLHANLLQYVQTGQAKLAAARGDLAKSSSLLRETILPQQQQRKMPCSVRTRVLLSRLSPESNDQPSGKEAHDEISKLAARHSGLAQCPLLNRILNNWEAWCDGEQDPEPLEEAEVRDRWWGV